MSTTVVLLLKTPADDVDNDPYHIELTARAFRPLFVPVLDTVLTSQDELQRIIKAGPSSARSGVTVTSGRAADAWKAAVESIQDEVLAGLRSFAAFRHA